MADTDFRGKAPSGGYRLMMYCSCGVICELVPDASDPNKFHYECHGCGSSDVLTRVEGSEERA